MRRASGQDDAKNRSEAEYVATGVDLVDRPDGLLRRHERRRAKQAASLRRPVLAAGGANLGAADGGVRIVARTAGTSQAAGHHLGQPPVHDLDIAEISDHDVGWLQVPMNHGVRVGIPDRLTHLLEDGQEPTTVGRRVGPVLQQCVEGPALNELHRQEGAAVGQGADLVNGWNSWVLHLACDVRLVEKPGGRRRLGREFIAENFDCHVPAQGDIPRAIDDPHAAAAKFVEQLVGRRSNLGQRPGGIAGRPGGEVIGWRIGTDGGIGQGHLPYRGGGRYGWRPSA